MSFYNLEASPLCLMLSLFLGGVYICILPSISALNIIYIIHNMMIVSSMMRSVAHIERIGDQICVNNFGC